MHSVYLLFPLPIQRFVYSEEQHDPSISLPPVRSFQVIIPQGQEVQIHYQLLYPEQRQSRCSADQQLPKDNSEGSWLLNQLRQHSHVCQGPSLDDVITHREGVDAS